MMELKKIALVVLALNSSIGFAGTMGSVCQPGNVTVPCPQTGWDFGVSALYLKPVYSGDLAFLSSNVTRFDQTTNEKGVENSQQLRWGFVLQGGYHFNSGNDLTLNWYHLNEKSNTFFGSSTSNVPDADLNTRTTATLKPSWDAVNLEFGQHVDMSLIQNMRFHGGVQYARITTKRSVETIDGADAIGRNNSELSYNGFGPRIGADMAYSLGRGFALHANGATAVLIGTSKSSRFASVSPAANPGNSYLYSKTALVPEIEGKLGLNFSRVVRQGVLEFDVGYLWINYFDAQLGALDNTMLYDSNFGVQGPYLGLKWFGSV